jgi:hypothetical protein
METDLIAYRWLGLLNEMDVSGRPLSEGSGPPQAHAMSEMEYVACPYADTRSSANKPMNRSALISITSCWDPICDWTNAVTMAYQKRQRIMEFTFLDVWRVAAVLRTAPFFILLRRSNEAHQQFNLIPEWVAGAYKAARGVEDAILHMACVGKDLVRPYSFDSLYDFVCKHRLFEGSSEVCAASPTLIKAFIEQVTRLPASLQSSSERSDVMLHPITLEPVMHQLLDYAACSTLVESLSTMYEVGRFRCLDLRRGLDSSAQLSAESRKEMDQGRYPLSGLARAMAENYGVANERLLRGYLQLTFSENASVCIELLKEPLLIDSTLAYASDDKKIERTAASYLRGVSDELFRAEHLIRTILAIEPLEALPSDDCLVAIFGASR